MNIIRMMKRYCNQLFIHSYIHSFIDIHRAVAHQHSVLGCHISYSVYIIVTVLPYSVTTEYCSALYCPCTVAAFPSSVRLRVWLHVERQQHQQQYLAVGMDAVITKPVNRPAMLAKIAAAVAGPVYARA